MTTIDILSRAGVDEAMDAKAQLAIKRFRQMQPTLTAYAKVLSGKKDVRVQIAVTDNGSTDGKNIYMRPPIGLGEDLPHDRKLCDKRDPDTKLQACSACAAREEVLVTIYHEIAHIAFDTFVKIPDSDKVQAINFAIRESGGAWAEQIRQRLNNLRPSDMKWYGQLASHINEFLPFLVNALEDARVNASMFAKRPGLRGMFYADTVQIFTKGFQQNLPEGGYKIVQWKEAPLNTQAMIGVFCLASGYDVTGWFHPDVEAVLADPELKSLVADMESIVNAQAVFNLSFKVLARLRDLGFCGTPQDPDPEPEEAEEDEPTLDENHEDQDDSEQPGEPEEGAEGEPREGDSRGEESQPDDGQEDSESREGGSDSEGPEGDETEESRPGEGTEEAEGEEEVDEEGNPNDSNDAEGSHDTDGNSGSSEGSPIRQQGDENESSDGDPDAEGDCGTGEVSDDSNETGVPEDAPASGVSSGGTGSVDDNGDGDLYGTEDSGDPGLDVSDSSGDPGVDPREDAEQGREDDESSPETDGDPIDTGADDGYGGTEVTGEVEPRPDMGTAEDAEPLFKQWNMHEEKPKTIELQREEEAMERAIIQGIYFTRPSQNVWGVREHHYEDLTKFARAWSRTGTTRTGKVADLNIPETILQPAIARTRRAFSDNQRGEAQTNLKRGKVNSRVLGQRAWDNDDRLFQKNTLPGRRDYEVVIGMDVSGSTVGRNLALEKRAIWAQAEMLHRVGIPFSIYAHTGDYWDSANMNHSLALQIYHVKGPKEQWNTKVKERLEKIGSASANLDGHALEYLRKKADESRATDKIIIYYTDGKMPQENHDEELDILTREILTCRNKGYVLLGVGIRTDSPVRHGLDTVQVDTDEDLMTVVKHLEKRISTGIRTR